MEFLNPRPGVLYLGIDGGGSKCRATVVAQDYRGSAVAGPANPFQNMDQALDSIVDAAAGALADAGLPSSAMGKLVAGVGLAGVNIPRIFRQVSDWQHPFARLYLTTDIHIACLGAHGGEDGAVIVAGTGSVGYACRNGISHNFGAHGFPFGDKGSGAWLGLEAMKAILLAMDELGPATSLTAAIEAHLSTSGLNVIAAMAGATSRTYGSLAPLVLSQAEAGDAVAQAIVQEGAAYLEALAGKLLDTGADSFCMLGGLSPRIIPWMSREVTEHLVDSRADPDIGAVLYGMAQHERQSLAG